MTRSPPWSPEETEQLVALISVMSVPDIAMKLGRSKNAVAGQIHRLRRKGVLSPPRPREGPAYGVADAANGAVAIKAPSSPDDEPPPTPPRPRLAVLPSPSPPPARECQWIEGDPRALKLCGAPAVAGFSYCLEHKSRCHTGKKAA